jgi:hypothetical protein
MRFVSAIGAAVFAYLTLIAFALLVSTWDNACAGPGCESAPAIRVLLTALYVACLFSLGLVVSLFAVHALTGNTGAFARIPLALKVAGGTIGVTLFFFVCLLSTAVAATLIVTAIVTWQLLYRYSQHDARRERAEAEIRRKLGPPPSNPELN